MSKWEKAGWILLGIITGLLWIGVCYAQAPNFDGTIGLIVSGDNNYEANIRQSLLQALRQKGYNVVLSEYKDSNSSYKVLEVKIKKNSGRSDQSSSYTPDYVPAFNLKVGGYSQSIDINSSSSKNTTIHHDEISVTMTIWQGNNAISSSCSVVPVDWQEISASNHYANKRDSGEALLKQGALVATAEAFNQLALPPPVSVRQTYRSDNSNGKIDLIVVQLVRKGGDGLIYYKIGKGQTLEGAFQSALRAEEKILPPKK